MGKPTTEQMSRELREKNKQAFLEGSHVQNPVYHGTGNLENMESFDPEQTGKGNDQLGSGFYFTNKPETANSYTNSVSPSAPKGATKLGGDTSPGVIAAHLAIKKPLRVGPEGSHLGDAGVNMTHMQVKRIMNMAPNIMHRDESPIADHVDTSKGVTPAMIHDIAKHYTGSSLHMLENDMFKNNPTAYRHAVHKVLGYDGVIKDFGNGEKHYVAWFPHQIKSAIGNQGTYDTSNPNITMAKGGAVKKYAAGGAATKDKELSIGDFYAHFPNIEKHIDLEHEPRPFHFELPPEMRGKHTGFNIHPTQKSHYVNGGGVSRVDMHHKDVVKRLPELTEAAQKVMSGKMTAKEYGALAHKLKPVAPFDAAPKLATTPQMHEALTKEKREKLGAPRDLEAGHKVGVRLDIPAYSNHGTWVASVHEHKAGPGAGPIIGYDSHAHVKNPTFSVATKAAEKYATGDTPKNTFATINGEWHPTTPEKAHATAQEAINHPDWAQVGMDPERHSYFYDRKTMRPIKSASEALQVGPLVLAKHPVYHDEDTESQFKYAAGGSVAR